MAEVWPTGGVYGSWYLCPGVAVSGRSAAMEGVGVRGRSGRWQGFGSSVRDRAKGLVRGGF